METGAWRGGVGIYARSIQLLRKAHGRVVLCDSFEGLPPASTAADASGWEEASYFRSRSTKHDVEDNFRKYRLWDPAVVLVQGFFHRTLPGARREQFGAGPPGGLVSPRIALLHLDGDMFESYMDSLFHLYDLVALGGVIVCDDCPYIIEAERAVVQFRLLHDIQEPLIKDITFYWRKERHVQVNYDHYLSWNGTRQFV